MLSIAKKVFGTRNDRLLKSYRPLVNKINDLERALKPLSNQELQAYTQRFKERLAQGASLNELEHEAFAVVREASIRVLGMRHFDVQLIGGHVLHQGMIAEMKTGEGKTLVATLPAYLNALTGKGVHIVTVNDYLARRDSDWMGQVHRFLGLSVGVVYSGMNEDGKRQAYASDITYGQNNEFGFDYLRDNMKFRSEDLVQRGHTFAIVDEVDSILIDEARTPLIISGPSEDSTELYVHINKIIPQLKKNEHYEIDLRTKTPTLKEEGIAAAEKLLGLDNLYDPQNIEVLHHVEQALRAYNTMERDVDYVVKDGKVIIVDEFTGRLMAGRRWSNGLHQAVEAKEGLRVERENQTLASITFQNLFRLYNKLSGMTGTADTEAAEFKAIYNLEVVVIPTNNPMIRKDQSDGIYKTTKEKYSAVVDDIEETHKTGQPILVGTISIERSEHLSKALVAREIPHSVLNAKHHEQEAEIVAQAGRFGGVTIATNMAGRGTDIVLGGNPEFMAATAIGSTDRESVEFQDALKAARQTCAAEREKVLAAGGLLIIGTERHESRRIDNQLRGRSGRQGDPGCSRFYISLEDDLMQRFGGERIQQIMQRLGWEEGVPLDGRIITGTIERAQKKVEAYHFEQRKHVTEYDDVMNKQRQVIYNLRHRILSNEGIRQQVVGLIDDLIEESVLSVCDERAKPSSWNLALLGERYSFLLNAPLTLDQSIPLSPQAIFDHIRESARAYYERHAQDQNSKLQQIRETYSKRDDLHISIPDFTFETYEQETFLQVLDHHWNEHLHEMDHLREGIGLRGYAQKNPLHEYQKEAFLLFQEMIRRQSEAVVRQLAYWNAASFENTILHFEAEYRRREEMMERMRLSHEEAARREGGGDPQEFSPKSFDEQRERLRAQRRERRRKR